MSEFKERRLHSYNVASVQVLSAPRGWAIHGQQGCGTTWVHNSFSVVTSVHLCSKEFLLDQIIIYSSETVSSFQKFAILHFAHFLNAPR